MSGGAKVSADLMLICMRNSIPNAEVLTAKTDEELAVLAVKHGVILPTHMEHLVPPAPPSPQWSPLQSPSAVIEDSSAWFGSGFTPAGIALTPRPDFGGSSSADDGDLRAPSARPKLKPKRVKGAAKRKAEAAAAAQQADGAAAAAEGPPKNAPKRLQGRGGKQRAKADEDDRPSSDDSSNRPTDAPPSNRPKLRPKRLMRGQRNTPSPQVLETVVEEDEGEEEHGREAQTPAPAPDG